MVIIDEVIYEIVVFVLINVCMGKLWIFILIVFFIIGMIKLIDFVELVWLVLGLGVFGWGVVDVFCMLWFVLLELIWLCFVLIVSEEYVVLVCVWCLFLLRIGVCFYCDWLVL